MERRGLQDVVWGGEYWLEHGCKVVLHCRHGQHRTGVAIYLVLRSMAEEPSQCLSLMKEMRPCMHTEILRKTKYRNLIGKAENIFTAPNFVQD